MRSSFVARLAGAATLLLSHVCFASPGEVDGERTVVTGRVSSYAWALNDGDVKNEKGKEGSDLLLSLYGARAGYRDYAYTDIGGDIYKSLGKGLNTWGAGYDAVLSVGLRSGRDRFGTVYGADFALAVPTGAGGGSVLHSISGRGSRVFARTMWGDFSLGYQEGVESSMKIDVLGPVVGQMGSMWGKYTRYFLRYTGGVPFHLYPGLYSENLLRVGGARDSIHGFSAKFRDVLNSVPSRFNYVSPRVRGLSVGLSYAVTAGAGSVLKGPGFDVTDAVSRVERDFLGESVRGGRRKVLALSVPRFDAGPEYKNILSSALRYELGRPGKKVAVVFSGEYARHRKLEDVLPRDYDYSDAGYLVEYSDLAAVSASAEGNYGGVKAAVTFGFLGKSGKPSTYVKMNAKGAVIEGTRRRVPYAKHGNSFYVATSLSYADGPVTATVAYYMSRLSYHPLRYVPKEDKFGDFVSPFDGENDLHDVALGLGYNVYRRGSANLEVFLNCHLYVAKQHYRKYTLKRGVQDFSLSDRGQTSNTGAVALAGLKFTF